MKKSAGIVYCLFLLIISCARPVVAPYVPAPAKDPKLMEEDEVHFMLGWTQRSKCLEDATKAIPYSLKTAQEKRIRCEFINTPEYRNSLRARLFDFYPKWTSKEKKAVLEGSIYLGMKPEHVRAVLADPDDKNQTVSRGGHREQWVYDGGSKNSTYVYFTNGILTEIQY